MKNKSMSCKVIRQPGFTLVEAVITISIGTLLVMGIVTFMIETGRLQSFISEQSDAIETADEATGVMTKALRESTDGADGSYAVVTAETNTLVFFSDVDADANAEQVTYTLSGTTITQTIIEPTAAPAEYLPANGITKTIATGIVNGTYTGNAIFSYYDLNNAILAEPIALSEVKLVKIHLDVNVDPNRVPDTHTIETYAQLRNLNDNL
ncbi:MAG: prepilin-type N-terminal cleavage/methylation domain-containing protein [Candidatus Kerfeldbacteria bacterium]|nr:prepilin-type N-terminal cleavage/methylation domain-containing protein [Candidatus Kerfeldbacteria bacterium]